MTEQESIKALCIASRKRINDLKDDIIVEKAKLSSLQGFCKHPDLKRTSGPYMIYELCPDCKYEKSTYTR